MQKHSLQSSDGLSDSSDKADQFYSSSINKTQVNTDKVRYFEFEIKQIAQIPKLTSTNIDDF